MIQRLFQITMIDSRTIFLLTCIAVAVLVMFVTRIRSKKLPNPSEKLRVLMAQRDDYLLFVGVPPAAPTQWTKVAETGNDVLTINGCSTIRLSEVKAFVVAYPNGQLVDWNSEGLSLPEDIVGLSPSADADFDTLQLGDLDLGRQYIQVEYGRSETRPHDRDYYSTAITNISDEKIRVVRFAGYTKTSKGWRISTVSNKFFSAEEFQQWYRLRDGEWVLPGQSVVDPNNYGGRPVLWAYYCESGSGKRFVTGSVLK